ncbi:MAG: hypothetical protein WDZ91_12585 [Paenibacillaceae bacterium]
MIDMDSIRIEKQTTRCSLAIRFIDAYTGKAPIPSGFQLVIDHVIQKPIIKPDGFIIYTNLPEGEYICRIKSNYYLPLTVNLFVDNKEPMISISLQPNASYPFGHKATYLRVAIKDKDGQLLNGASISAVCTSKLYAKAILAQEVSVGARDIVLTHIKGKVLEGDFFLIINKGKEAPHDEYCCISKEIDGFRNFMLDQPLQSAYPRGTMFLGAVKTHTDGTGEAVIPFRNPPSGSFVVQLTIEWKDFIMVREVEVKEAEATYIGVIDLDLGEALI